ncbi:fatty acid desaturase [Aureococcus anophagefferens]|nr:fatty acid desaturase [Aureococcus anophagefferens]
MDYLRTLDAPMALKYAAVAFMSVTWKWWYYAPNTFKQLKANERRRAGLPPLEGVEAPQTFDFGWLVGKGDNTYVNGFEFLSRVPALRAALPARRCPLLAPASPYRRTAANLFLAELMTNFHSFVVIATNHAGFDLYRFDKHCKPRSSTFYLRQVISSANRPAARI